MSRQIGVALGVAILVSVLGTSSGDAVVRFSDGWAVMAAAGLLAAGAFAAIGPACSRVPRAVADPA
jgi:hypothetical protein